MALDLSSYLASIVNSLANNATPVSNALQAIQNYVNGNMDGNARVAVRKNTGGANVGVRRRLNFIEGSNVTLTVTDDPTNEEVQATIAIPTGGLLVSVQVFTSSGIWTRPAGITKVLAEVIGGGGGGGGIGTAGNRAGSGGGGGGYSRKLIDVSAISTETVTVGSGGIGGSTVPSNGTAGSTSSFGAHCSASGGNGGVLGGAGTPPAGGDGGVGSNGNINVKGQPGGLGFSEVAYPVGGSGHGGSSHLGGGGRPVGDSDGQAGGNYGGGGAGGINISSTVGRTGGSGAQGVVLVWEYK